MKHKIFFTLACALLFAVILHAYPRPAKLRNVLLIVADDLGYGDIGCMGAKNFKTPNIDSLASNGIVFSQGYATASTCTPSRYSMLTGEYAWRQKGKKTVILDGNDPLCIPQGAFTLPKIFKAAGYRTAAIGKWHLGLGDGSKELDFNGEIKPNPNSVGFDYSYIIPATVDRVPSVWLKNGKVENLDPKDPITVSYSKNISDTPTGAERPDLLKQGADAQHSGSIINGISRIGYMRGGKTARFVDEQIPNVVVSQAAKFIESNKNKPFFLYVGLFEPHVPRTVDKKFEGASQCGIRGDAIVQADWQVGEIVKKLKDAGIYENTVIIFSSDNGPVLFDGYFDNSENETNGHSPSGILRGGKYLVYEGGMRVPFIVVNPDAVKNGLNSEIVGLNDLPATFAKKLGIPVPSGAAFDSIDVSAAFDSADGKSGRNEIVLQGANGLSIRSGKWKFAPKSKNAKINAGSNANTRDKRFVEAVVAEDSLYDLSSDPSEKRNLASEYPQVVEALKRRLKEIVDSK